MGSDFDRLITIQWKVRADAKHDKCKGIWQKIFKLLLLPTPKSPDHLDAATFIESIEKRQGLKIACPEEIAGRIGFIDDGEVSQIASKINAPYSIYLKRSAQ